MSGAAKAKRSDIAQSGRNQLGQALGAKGLQTRRRILDATAALLRTTPMRDLKVAHITREADASKGTFYVYFNSVEEAVLALVGEVSQSPPNLVALFATPWTKENAEERANAFVSGYMDHWNLHGPLFRARNLASEEGDKRFSDARVAALMPLVTAMGACAAKRQAVGGLPADLDVLLASGALLAMIERIAVVRLDASRRGVTLRKLISVAVFFALLLFAPAGKYTAARVSSLDGYDVNGLSRPSAKAADQAERVNLDGQIMGAKGEQTRARLIAATIELLGAKALRDISVADIAKLAKSSKTNFYLYFADASEAVLAALQQVSERRPVFNAMERCLARAGRCDEMALEFVTTYITWWQSNRAVFRVRNIAADEGDMRFAVVREQSVRTFLEILTERIARNEEAGALPSYLHPYSTAGAMLAMVERISVSTQLTLRGENAMERVCRAVAYFLSVLIGGAPKGFWAASSGADLKLVWRA